MRRPNKVHIFYEGIYGWTVLYPKPKSELSKAVLNYGELAKKFCAHLDNKQGLKYEN